MNVFDMAKEDFEEFRKEADGQEILESLARWLLFHRTMHTKAAGCVWIS